MITADSPLERLRRKTSVLTFPGFYSTRPGVASELPANWIKESESCRAACAFYSPAMTRASHRRATDSVPQS